MYIHVYKYNAELSVVYNNSTLNVSALHHDSLTGEVNTTEYCSDCLPRWIWVITGIEVKVGISLSGGALEAPLDFIHLRVW